MKLIIYKVGGKIINDEVLLNLFLDEIAKTDTRKIIVHGGGNKASELMRRTGLTPKMVEGRRITDASALEIVTMVVLGGVSILGGSGSIPGVVIAAFVMGLVAVFVFTYDFFRLNRVGLTASTNAPLPAAIQYVLE